MLLSLFGPRELRCPRRRTFDAAAGLLTLIVFLSGGLRVHAARQDDTKKDQPRKETPKELKKESPDRDDSKKDDADKEIDQLIEEMTRQMPPGLPAEAAKRMREQVRQQIGNLTAEQRKQMLEMLRRRKQPGFPGLPGGLPGGFPMPPGLGGAQPNPRLGARLEPASAALADQLDLPKGQGLVVRDVMPDSTAAKAGLKAHDVLLEFNGKTVSNRLDELVRQMADIKPDTTVEIVVLRKGKKETIKDVKLPEAAAGAPGLPPGIGFPPGGLQPPGGGFAPPGFAPLPGGDGQSVITTITRTRDRLTVRHQEGSMSITLMGTAEDGKVKINAIHVQDGGPPDKYESVDKVPEKYREKVKNLIEMSEKSSAHTESK